MHVRLRQKNAARANADVSPATLNPATDAKTAG
jgi:hypothetical protein